MKYPILYFSTLLLVVILSFSCRPDRHSSDVLKQAEVLLEEHPDSSLALLNKVNSTSLQKDDNARYCLLMTKSLIKNAIPIVSDSLINIAIGYYKDNGDSINKAEAYFYAGRVNQDMHDAKGAMAFYLKALDFSENSNDYKLQYLIYFYLGDLYINEGLFDSALMMQQKALTFSRLLNNSAYITYALKDIASSYRGKGYNDSALDYYYQALALLPKTDTIILITLYNEMAEVYNKSGDYAHAIQFVNNAIKLNPSPESLFYCNFIKGNTYLNLERYDSAISCYNKTVHSPNLYTRASSYHGLASTYNAKGDYKSAYKLMQVFDSCRDSIDDQTKSAAIIEMQNLYQHGKSKEQIQRLTVEKQKQTIRYYHVSFLSFITLLLLSVAFFIYRNRNKKELFEKSKILLEQENRPIKMREKESQLREDFFKKLNNIKKIPSLGLADKKEKDLPVDATTKISLTGNDWEELIRNIDVAYDHFTDRLIKAYPNLTIQEVHLCCLVKIKVARNDLANIFCITPQSVKTTKYRIKKEKMGISDRNITLDLFLEKF